MEETLDSETLIGEMLKKFEVACRIIKRKEDYLKWIKFLNRSVMLTKKLLRGYGRKNKKLHRLESQLALFKYYREHLKRKHKQNFSEKNIKRNLIWLDVESCFRGRIRTGSIINLKFKDPGIFFNKAFRIFSSKIKKSLKQSLLKINVIFIDNFVKPQTGETDIKYFSTKNRVIDPNTGIKQFYLDHVKNKILTTLEKFQERDSGWALYEILQLKLNINKFTPINVGLSTYVEVYSKHKGSSEY